MTLKSRIHEDMKAAMRAKDAARLSAIRLLLAAMKQREVDERIELSGADVTVILERLIKQRRESITLYEKGGRTDLAQGERFEIDVLTGYLPKQLSAAEIEQAVADAIADAAAGSPKDMGKVMGLLKARFAGRADLGAASALVKSKLGG